MAEAGEGGCDVHAQEAGLVQLGVGHDAVLAAGRVGNDDVVQELPSRNKPALDGRDLLHQRVELAVRCGCDDLDVCVLHCEGRNWLVSRVHSASPEGSSPLGSMAIIELFMS